MEFESVDAMDANLKGKGRLLMAEFDLMEFERTYPGEESKA